MHKLVKDFFNQRAISTDINMNKPLHNAILYLEKTDKILDKMVENNIKKLEKNAPWPSMHDLKGFVKLTMKLAIELYTWHYVLKHIMTLRIS